MEINQATGEISVTLAGTAFRLHGTLSRMAALEAALNVSGFAAMQMQLLRGSPKAIHLGLKHLCASDNAAAVDGLAYGLMAGDGQRAVLAAMVAALPEPEPDSGNGQAPAAM